MAHLIGSRGARFVVILFAALACAALAGCAPGGVAQDEVSVPYTVDPATDERAPDVTPRTVDRSLQVFTVLPQDGIPAIRAPEFVDASAAEAWMTADEPVIGVNIGGRAHAYPTAMLSRHEIVNDTIEGAPIAVTW